MIFLPPLHFAPKILTFSSTMEALLSQFLLFYSLCVHHPFSCVLLSLSMPVTLYSKYELIPRLGVVETEVSGDLAEELSPTVGIQLGRSTGSLLCCIRAGIWAHLINTLSCVLSAVYLPLGLLCKSVLCCFFCQCMTNLYLFLAA